MQKSEIHNINHDDVLKHLHASNDLPHPDYLIKVIFRKREGFDWHLYSAKFSPNTAGEPEAFEQYPEAVFATIHRTFQTAEELFNELLGDGVPIRDELPNIHISKSKKWSQTLIPSLHSFYEWPVRDFHIRTDAPNLGDDKLIAYGLPYRRSFRESAQDIIDIRWRHDPSIDVFILDERGKLVNDKQQVEPYVICNHSIIGEYYSIPENIMVPCSTNLSEDLCNIGEAEIWLVDDQNIILDYISSSEFPYNFVPSISDHSMRNKMVDAINEGETETVEFKKYVDLTEKGQKPHELKRTVCALSNHRGGLLLIGVGNNGDPIGIDIPVKKSYRCNLSDAIYEYINDLKRLLIESLSKNDCFNIHRVDWQGYAFIVINVLKTEGWNIVLDEDVPFLRRGGTNYKAIRYLVDHNQSREHL